MRVWMVVLVALAAFLAIWLGQMLTPMAARFGDALLSARFRRVTFGTLVVLALLLGTACGSKGTAQIGGDDRAVPDRQVLFSHLCAGNEDAARAHLHAAEFAYLGARLERWYVDARDRAIEDPKRCPCAVGVCQK